MPSDGERSMFWILVQEERTIMMRVQAMQRSVMVALKSDHWRADRRKDGRVWAGDGSNWRERRG